MGTILSSTIELGTNYVAHAIFAARRNAPLSLQHVSVESWAEPANHEQWLADVASALARLAERTPHHGRRVMLALPGHLTLTKTIKIPTIAPEKRQRIVTFEAAQSLPIPLEEVVWDHAPLSEHAGELTLTLVAAKRVIIDRLITAIHAAGFTIERIIPAGLALAEALRRQGGESGCRVLAALGERSTELVFVDGERAYTRTVTLRCDFGATWLDRLHAEILRTSLAVQRDHHFAAPEKIFVVERATSSTDLLTGLSARLKLPVERFNPQSDLEVNSTAPSTPLNSFSLATLTGLALAQQHPGLDLSPAALRAEREFRERQPALLITAALLLVAFLLPGLHYAALADAAARRAHELETALQPVHALERRNAENLAALDALRPRLAAFEQLATARTTWAEFLDDLERRLASTGEAWLERMRVAHTTNETASAPLRLQLSGCLLDRASLLASDNADTHVRAKTLLASLGHAPSITALESERFDHASAGVLRFEVTLVLAPNRL